MLPLLLLSLFLVAQPPASRGQPAEVTVKYAILVYAIWAPWPQQNIFPAFDYYSERLNSGHWNGKRLTAGNTTIRLERDIIQYDLSGWTAEQMDALTNDTYVALISYGLLPDVVLPLAQHKNLLHVVGWSLDAVSADSFVFDKYPLSPEVGQGILSPFKTRGYTKCAVISSHHLFYRPYADLVIDAIRRENMTLTLLMDVPLYPDAGEETTREAVHRPLIALGYAADQAVIDEYGNWTFEHEDPLNPGTNKTYGPKLLGNNHLGEDFAQALKETGTEVLIHHGFADSLTLGPDNYTKMNMDVENEFFQILIDKGVDLKGWFRDPQIATGDTYYQYGAHNLTDFLLTNAEWTSKVNHYDAFLDVWSSDLIADYNAWPNRTTDYDRLVNQHIHAVHLLAIAISFLTEWSPDMDTNRAAIKLELWRNSFDTFWDANLRFDKDNRLNGAFVLLQQFPGTTSFSDLKAVAPEAVAEVPIQIPMPSFQSRFVGCPPGTFNTGLRCANCSANTFSDVTNTSRCDFCPPGTGQPLEGQTSCEMCPPGFANPGNSDAGCQICQEGFFSEAQGSATCQRCAKGFYSDQKGEQSCQPCSTKGSETRTTDTLGSVSRKQCVCKSGYFFTGLYTNGFNGTIRANDLVNATLPRGTCKLCNDNLYKCPGRFDPPRAKPGYYMESYRIRDNNDFPTIYECNPRSSCPGGGPRSCSAHRVGLACGRCEEGYTRGSGGRCSKCFMSGGIFGFFLLCLLVMMPIAMYFYAKTSYVAPRRGRSENVSGVSSRSVMSSQAERDAALDPNKAFLIILSFLQHIGIISSFNLRIVVQVSTLLSLPRLLMVDPSILGVSCFGLDSFSRQIGYLFSIPIIFITAVAILHFTLEGFLFYGKKWDCLNPDKARGRRKAWLHWFRRKFVDTAHGLGLIRIVATTTQVSSFMYVALVSIAMAHVDCFRHPSGDFTVRTHPYVICDWESARGQEWRDQMWLSWIGIFLYIICPYIASIAISFRMQKLTDLKRRDKAAHLEGFDEVFSAAFRYVVGKYRQGMVWWECVWMARNASLALSTALVPNIGQLQLLYYAVILTFYAFATMSFAPWRRSANSKLDIALTVLLLHIVTLIGLFYTFALPPSDINATDARAATGALMFIYLLLIVPITWWYGSRHPQRYFDRRHPQGLLGKTASKWLNMFNSLPNLRGMEGQRRNPLTGSITDDDISPRPRRNKINPKLSVRSDLGNESDPFSRGTIESDDGYESPRPGRRPRPHHRGTTESPSASSSDIKFTSSRRGDDSTTGGRLTAHANASQTRVVPGLHMKQDGAWAGKPGPDTTAMSDVDAFDDQDGLESGLSDRGGHSVRTPAHKEVFLGFESQLRKTMRMSESRSGSNPFESAVRP